MGVFAAILSAFIVAHGGVQTRFDCNLDPNVGPTSGVAGYWTPGAIGLNPDVCVTAMREGRTQATGETAAMFLMLVSHEIGHAVYGNNEHTADCAAARFLPAVAYAAGLRGKLRFAALIAAAKQYGGDYGPIPARCWNG